VKHFVTGGAGFIGSNYVRYVLNNTDDEVTVYDMLTYAGLLTTMSDFIDSSRVHFAYGDVCDKDSLLVAMNGADYVVHFAAETHVDRSILLSDDFVRTNCTGTDSVMNVAQHIGVKKVVHIGTDEVYGSVETGSSLETDPLEPRSPYSASKAGSDLIALSHFHTHGLPVSVTRCTNNFGPYQFPEKAIPLFVTNIFQNKKIPLYGDGLNERDWIDVHDHCAAVYKVLTDGESGQIYNIGAGNGTSNIDLVGMILRYFEQDPNEWIERVQDRKGHDRRYSVDVSKITNLGWKPIHNIEDSLSYTIDWYRSNRWWWEPLKNV
jgi:dTDP-glucose 4,6-dehydratase